MKTIARWHSDRLGQEIALARWGTHGTPVLIFPTAGGDYEEIERFHMVSALGQLIEDGKAKVYSMDSINGRAWLTGDDPHYAAWLQNQFDEAVHREVVPAIYTDCGGAPLPIIVAGSSIGAFNALEVLCRHPETFSVAICLSGTYDLGKWLQGSWSTDFYFSSPLHYLPELPEGEQLRLLRRCFVLLAHGTGRYEDPQESWRVAEVLGAKAIPNRVDEWDGYSHDWVTWREMMPRYLEEFLPG